MATISQIRERRDREKRLYADRNDLIELAAAFEDERDAVLEEVEKLKGERDASWAAVDRLSPRFKYPDFKFASFAGAVEAMIKDREDADAEVERLKAAIRNHRDQRGNDRCFLDDAELYAVLGEGQPDTTLPPKEVFLAQCEKFYECRQSGKPYKKDDAEFFADLEGDHVPLAGAPRHFESQHLGTFDDHQEKREHVLRIQLLSDLHFEFHPDRGRKFVAGLDPSDVDVLVVAGDLMPGVELPEALAKLRRRYPHVVFVAGNHEYYYSSPYEMDRIKARVAKEQDNVHWLENETIELGGVRFVGSTLWFEDLGGRKNYLNDFRMIKNFEPWVYERSHASKEFLSKEVHPGDVVVTHYLPSYSSVAPQYLDSPLNCFFVSDVENAIIKRNEPELWFHGHTHASCDYKIGRTRVVCNPYGYDGQETNRQFDKRKIIEIK